MRVIQLTTDPGVIDYADYAERFTQPGVDLGSGDLLKTIKDAALSKLVEWGATRAEGSVGRWAMGVSYALTDAILPGSYDEAAIGAGAGPLLGKGIVLGTGVLNATASKYVLTSWAADDLGLLASRVGERLGTNLAAPRQLNPQFGGVLADLGAGDAVGGIGLKLGNRRLPEADLPWIIYQKHVTGRGYEEIWQLGQSKIALDARRFGFTVEAKWTGRNESAWKSSPYHPDHRYYDEAKILNQARSQLELNESLRGKGVRYLVSNEAAQSHFTTLFERNFGSQMKLGTLRVWHVPGNGMR
jgi:hypothetical protein